MGVVQPKRHYEVQNIAHIIEGLFKAYPFWMAHEFPEGYRLSNRHNVPTISVHMSTGRIFDIRIIERRTRK